MPSHVVVLGGGTAGLEVARRLERSDLDLHLTLVNPDGNHTYQPLLPEVAAGTLDARQAVLPLRTGLQRTEILQGTVEARSDDGRTVRVRGHGSSPIVLPYDHLVVAVGAISRVPPIPGLAERAIGFRTLPEAVHLRDRILDLLQVAESCGDDRRRRAALTFLCVGGGYSGVEATGELHDMAVLAAEQLPGIDRDELRFVLVEATDTLLSMVGEGLQRATLDALRERGIDVRLDELVEYVDDDGAHLAGGDVIDAATIVWAAGVRPNPVVEDLDLPTNDDGAVVVSSTLEVAGLAGVWAAGDCAAVPDPHDPDGGTYPPTGQAAAQQGKLLAANIERRVRAEDPVEFRYRSKGEIVTLGATSAVGEVFGVPVRGRLAWAMRTALHVARVPTFRRKARVLVDWTTNLLFRREITSLGAVREPRAPFEAAIDASEDDAASS